MVDITTIEPNTLPKPTLVLIDSNRVLISKNKQLKYFATALVVISILAMAYIQVNNPIKEDDKY